MTKTSERLTLDTSGEVKEYDSSGDLMGARRWNSLSPFEQGYIEAMMRELYESRERQMPNNAHLGFVHTSPEALDMIRQDCALAMRIDAHEQGAAFWRVRQNHPEYLVYTYGDALPPLTVFLDDTGKINLRPRAEGEA